MHTQNTSWDVRNYGRIPAMRLNDNTTRLYDTTYNGCAIGRPLPSYLLSPIYPWATCCPLIEDHAFEMTTMSQCLRMSFGCPPSSLVCGCGGGIKT